MMAPCSTQMRMGQGMFVGAVVVFAVGMLKGVPVSALDAACQDCTYCTEEA